MFSLPVLVVVITLVAAAAVATAGIAAAEAASTVVCVFADRTSGLLVEPALHLCLPAVQVLSRLHHVRLRDLQLT